MRPAPGAHLDTATVTPSDGGKIWEVLDISQSLRPAECNSAIQQITNLRYEVCALTPCWWQCQDAPLPEWRARKNLFKPPNLFNLSNSFN
jgi:hypothetical protein